MRHVRKLVRARNEEPALTIQLDYPVEPRSRHGWGRPSHPQLETIIGGERGRYAQALRGFTELAEPLAHISVEWVDAPEPFWNNNWFQGLDIVALYAHLAQRDARTCIEVGSGYSTRVARRAIEDHGLRTLLVAIDPKPRSSVAAIVDEHIPAALEEVELEVFERLEAGDVLLFDGSHRALTNSDATVFFNEVLPRLAAGVLVQVHDIFLPWDYRPDWADRWYSEQYLLASWLLGGSRLQVAMPNFFVSLEPELNELLVPIWSRLAPREVNLECPSAFWFEVRGDPAPPAREAR